jgi:hypothetical protein
MGAGGGGDDIPGDEDAELLMPAATFSTLHAVAPVNHLPLYSLDLMSKLTLI